MKSLIVVARSARGLLQNAGVRVLGGLNVVRGSFRRFRSPSGCWAHSVTLEDPEENNVEFGVLRIPKSLGPSSEREEEVA